MLSARPINNDQDAEIAKKWRKEHGWKAEVPLHILPANGMVVEHGGEPVAMAWLVRTDTPVAWIHWMVSNRYADKEVRNSAIDYLMRSLEALAFGLGYEQLLTWTLHNATRSRFKRLKYMKADDKATVYMKGLVDGRRSDSISSD